MKTDARSAADDLKTLARNVSDLLGSTDQHVRIAAVNHLAIGIEQLEKRVVHEAQESGMTWDQIGKVYGVSRQAVHRRFAETVVPAEFFDELLASLDEQAEVVDTLARATKRADSSDKTR
ncbi:MAG: hypothetical protein M5U23_06580 [Acidimicrobiia bacterium]|nr:hypothetical protein [Acidimicrobiia bacterium]